MLFHVQGEQIERVGNRDHLELLGDPLVAPEPVQKRGPEISVVEDAVQIGTENPAVF